MKKLTKELLMLMMATFVVVGCNSEAPKEEEKNASNEKSVAYNNVDVASLNFKAPATITLSDDDLMAVAYLDINSIINKSGLTAIQRELLGAGVASEIEDPNMQQYVMEVFNDIDASGLKLSKPVYATYSVGIVDNEPVIEAIVVAEVSDANILDKVATNADAEFERYGDIRYADARDDSNNYTFGYNNDYFVIALTMNSDSHDLFRATLDNAKMNLSAFAGREIGIFFNYSRLMALTNPALMHNEIVAEFLSDEDIKCLAGLSFEPGRIVIDAKYSGYNQKFNKLYNTLDNENLKYVSSDAIAFANISLNGKELVALVEDFLTPRRERELAEALGMNPNGLVTTLQIIYDIVGSIDGAITLALNDLQAITVYEEDYKVANTEYSFDAQLMANVSNNYIIENVPMLGDMVNKVGPNKYSIRFGDNRFNIGQTDNLFRIGINDPCDNTPETNMYAKWNSKFNHSIGYFVVDIQNLIDSSIGKKFMREVRNEMDYDDRKVLDSMIDMLDCFWFNSNDNKSSEIVLSFDDTETNALQQIVSFYLSTIN